MKKLILITAISFLAFVSYGQLTFTDNGDAIGVTGGGESLNFSKSGLLIQKHNDNIEFVTGGRLFRYNLAYIDVPAYSTIDSVYDEIATWLSGSYVFSGGITADSATIDWLTGDTVIYDYIEGDTILVNKLIWPDANDGAPIGTVTVAFSDLFLAEGAVIGWDNGDATLTQTGNLVELAGANLTVPTATVTTLTDGTQSQTAGNITSGNVWAADSITANYFSDGTFAVTGGAFTGVVSITDGTASWTGSQLSGFTEITADSIVVTTAIYPGGGNLVNLGDVTNFWNLVYSDSLITNYISSTTITDGTMTSFGGVFTGVASISDGTAEWTDSQDLKGFDTISATYITDGTAYLTGGELNVTDITINTPVNIYGLSHNSFADYVAEQHFFQAEIDSVNTSLTGLLYAASGVLSVLDTGTLIPTVTTLAGYVTPTYTGDLDITGNIYADSIHADDDIIAVGKVEGTYNHASLVGEDVLTVIPFYGFKSTNDGGNYYAGMVDYSGAGADSILFFAWLNPTLSEAYYFNIDSNRIEIGSGGGSANIYIGDALNDDDIITLSSDSILINAENNIRISTDEGDLYLSTDGSIYLQGYTEITGDLDITGKVTASDSLCIGKFRLYIIADTLCSVAEDTVRLHPPR